MDVAKVFAKGGPIAVASGARYEQRAGQVEMATAVAKVFEEGGSLLVEAPTGTGKSHAYAVPAIAQVAQHRRTVIVTANIALQEQLVARDLPFLQAALPEAPFKFALAKGIGNYLCRSAWDDAIGDSILLGESRYDGSAWKALTEWVGVTQKGDLSELDIELPGRVRAAVTVTSDDCTGRKCPRYEQCFGVAARRAYASADIVVTNYHLFFADLAIRAGEGHGVLPDYDLVILDEAHQAADIARDFFGFRVTYGAIKWAVRLLGQDLQAPILASASRLLKGLAARKRPRITTPGEVSAAELVARLQAAAGALKGKAKLELVQEQVEKLNLAARRAEVLAANLQAAEACDQADVVFFVEKATSENGYPAIAAKPIKVAKLLEGLLFESEKIRAVVGTSATLTSDGDFDFMVGEIGAFEAKELQVESPFDHRGAAVLIVPPDLPDPKHGEFAVRVGEVVVETIQRAKGRTLALFTSYRVLDVAHKAALEARLGVRVLRQGEAPRTKLIEEFRSDVSSVLFGTASFWEGIDVQGEALSAVVIDRLPFDHPEDPVLEAIVEKDPRGWFGRYSLPRSIIAFRQGFGRLIRSRTDRGVIVVCDRRIIDKPYGSRYVRSLPAGVRLARSLDAIGEVLG